MKRVCFYHTDGDGQCAGAIIGDYFGWDIEMRPINYGNEFPFNEITQDTIVYMVDFSLEPFSEMVSLHERAGELIWIDHHDSVFAEAEEFEDVLGHPIRGTRDVSKAACELTWEYVYGKEKIPTAVMMLADYDMWKHSDPLVLQFQYGFRSLENTDPSNIESRLLWNALLHSGQYLAQIFDTGRAILRYINEQNAKASKSIAFETEIDGIKVIAANVGGVNSYFFDSVLDDFPNAVAAMPFVYSKGRWTVHLYSIKGREHPHLGNIAKKMGEDESFGGGGGGRTGTAGFQWHSTSQYLPFPIYIRPVRE